MWAAVRVHKIRLYRARTSVYAISALYLWSYAITFCVEAAQPGAHSIRHKNEADTRYLTLQ